MLSFRIALRFLRSSRGQTILIVLGIAVGIGVQLFVGLLLNTLQASLVLETVGNSSHVTVLSTLDNATIDDWRPMVEEIDDIGGLSTVSVAADQNGFINFANVTEPVLVRGFDLDDADQIYDISDRTYDGAMPDAEGEIMVGRELNEELNAELNERVWISTPNGSRHEVTIVGFFDLEVARLNEGWIITNLDTVQQIFALGDQITSIEMQVDEVFNAESIARDVASTITDPTVEVENWIENNQQLLSALQAQSSSSLMIQTFVLVSVVIAIASVLAVSVLQKSKQLGILKAMGITDRAASLVFLSEGFILGVGGGLIGTAIGTGLFLGFSIGAGYFAEVPVDYSYIFISLAVAILASTFAGLIPARKSAKLDPIEVIRDG